MSPPADTRLLRSWAEIRLDAIEHNARVALDRARGAGLMAVIKGDAYGHGFEHAVPVLAPYARFFAVASAAEAARVESVLSSTPKPHPKLFLLGSSLPEEQRLAATRGWHLSVSSFEEISACAALGNELGIPVAVHLVVDTGMGRIGFLEGDFLQAVATALQQYPHLQIAGLATHLPCAGEDDAYTETQIRRTCEIFRAARQLLPHSVDCHYHNSAGLLRFPRPDVDLVRPGILLFGVSPVPEHESALKSVMSFRTRVTLVRTLPAGHGISYGRTWIAPHPVRVATLGAGYADGYPRHLSSSGASVLIGGQRCPLLGRVSMDQIMADVSQLSPEPRPGDEAVLFGEQGAASCPVHEVARLAGTIPWEILTGITARVQRIPADGRETSGSARLPS